MGSTNSTDTVTPLIRGPMTDTSRPQHSIYRDDISASAEQRYGQPSPGGKRLNVWRKLGRLPSYRRLVHIRTYPKVRDTIWSSQLVPFPRGNSWESSLSHDLQHRDNSGIQWHSRVDRTGCQGTLLTTRDRRHLYSRAPSTRHSWQSSSKHYAEMRSIRFFLD